jgi:hypothetical protein
MQIAENILEVHTMDTNEKEIVPPLMRSISSKLDKHFAPIGFTLVSTGIYRSAYPIPRNYSFIECFHFKTFVCLAPSEMGQELKDYCNNGDQKINLLGFEIKLNQEPFRNMDVSEMKKALVAISDPQNHPVLVFCLNGKVRIYSMSFSFLFIHFIVCQVKTSCLVACYRKSHPSQQWSMVNIIDEFERFTDPIDGGLSDLTFIERFK